MTESDCFDGILTTTIDREVYSVLLCLLLNSPALFRTTDNSKEIYLHGVFFAYYHSTK